MPLDPQCQAILTAIESMGLPPFATLTPEQTRQSVQGFTMLMGEPETMAAVEDRQLPGSDSPVPVRIYTPPDAGPAPRPVLVWFHLGGFVFGSVDWVDPITRTLANRSGCIVVSVDYRLAPEHPYPAARDDAWAAVTWVAEHAAEIGADPTRLAVGGDSAGGSLATVCCLMAREQGGPAIAFQVLIYPSPDCTEAAFDLPSHKENGEAGLLITNADLRLWWSHYLSGGADPLDPYVSPLHAPDLSGLPPALVITAEYDPLRDPGEEYARRLAEAGVPTELRRYDGQIHAFFIIPGAVERARECMDEVGAALRKALGA
ncbi:MAG: alpha/beta hydrolase [Acidimicrobiia bacterium]